MKGKLFIVSAPSGAGKTTLIREVLGRFNTLSYSISHTTRQPREKEVHGEDYFFVDPEAFEEMIRQGRMLEWAKVHDNYYGTSKAFVEETLEKGRSLLLDIDVQGARQIMDAGMNAVTIFILPPSLEVLEQRLKGRGTDTEEVIRTRLKNALTEMEQKDFYRHKLVNDDLAQAVEEICSIFQAELGGI